MAKCIEEKNYWIKDRTEVVVFGQKDKGLKVSAVSSDDREKRKTSTGKQTNKGGVMSYLGGGFVPAHEAVLPGELLQFGQLGAQAGTPLVALVGQ